MANKGKRISELTQLTSASLDTTIVGIDNGTTYKIELDTLADAVALRVNILDRDRLNSLESKSGSYLTSLNGTISGSSQLTSSYDARYVVSGSITQTTWDNISGKPNGLISQSTDLSLLNSFTSSQEVKNTAFTNGISGRLTTSSFNSYIESQSTSSLVNRLNTIESQTGSYLTSLSGAISSSSQLTSSFDIRYTLSGSVQTLPLNLISSSTQISDFGFISSSHTDITSLNSFTSSQSTLNIAFTNGISARLQTSSFNDYTASVNGRITTLEGTIITGSVNYTQVLGNKRTNITTINVSLISGSITTTGNPVQIMVTGDANPTSTGWCRLQLYRGESAIGNIVQVENESNQNVPYCLNIIDTPSSGTHIYSMRTVSGIAGTFEFGEASGPLLTAVELRTNTNLPSTNNTFTGNNTFNGITTFGTNGGDEGGEIQFGIPQTNTTLQNRVTTDIFQNRLRIFEGSANAKGVYIDLSKAPNAAGGEITWKASGIVNRGVDVTLGNLKARLAATGNESLQLSTVSGTYNIYGSGTYNQSGTIAGVTLTSTLLITTTPTYVVPGYDFAVAGAVDVWNIVDVGSGIAWRITMIIGFSYLNNFISIERLH